MRYQPDESELHDELELNELPDDELLSDEPEPHDAVDTSQAGCDR
jgi:hypothetical protein